MHDLQLIRENPEAFDAALARRGLEPVSAAILALDERRRTAITRAQEGQARRNEASKAIGQAMGAGDTARAEALKAEVAALKDTLPALEAEEREAGAELDALLAALPNLPLGEVPDGADEAGNVEQARWGQRREFTFAPKEHADLGPPLGLDFETGAAMSGARFTFLRGGIARLHRALGQFMLDLHTTRHGYAECAPPLLVWDKALFGTGQLPKFEDDLYLVGTEFTKLKQNYATAASLFDHLTKDSDFSSKQNERLDAFLQRQISRGQDMSELSAIFEDYVKYFKEKGSDFREFRESFSNFATRFAAIESSGAGHSHYLIPTSEVSLTNSVREQILDLSAPIRLTALTPCFRSEAGAAGKDTRGFIRQHQFEKVELVTICRDEDWRAEHEHMVASAEAVLEALELPYRRMLLCAGDMGASARKTFDLEVWLPGQGAYREISSISWCGDWQARRMKARYRPAKDSGGQKGTAFVHTLNGSGVAVGRALVAVLENYQQEDGSVTVPAALVPYMGGVARLEFVGGV